MSQLARGRCQTQMVGICSPQASQVGLGRGQVGVVQIRSDQIWVRSSRGKDQIWLSRFVLIWTLTSTIVSLAGPFAVDQGPIQSSGYWMLVTCIPYVIIQIAAFG